MGGDLGGVKYYFFVGGGFGTFVGGPFFGVV